MSEGTARALRGYVEEETPTFLARYHAALARRAWESGVNRSDSAGLRAALVDPPSESRPSAPPEPADADEAVGTCPSCRVELEISVFDLVHNQVEVVCRVCGFEATQAVDPDASLSHRPR